MPDCGWCRRPLQPDETRFVPRVIRYLAAISAAFIHAGMWVMEWLAEPFCARCRNALVPAIAVVAAAELALVAFLARLWLKR